MVTQESCGAIQGYEPNVENVHRDAVMPNNAAPGAGGRPPAATGARRAGSQAFGAAGGYAVVV